MHVRIPSILPMRSRAAIAGVAAALAVGTVLTAAPAAAAGPWFVASNGSNAASCLSAAAPCQTVQGALNKPAFQSGDTINVAAGTYTGVTTFTTKGAKVVGAGAGAVFNGNNAGSTMAVTGNVPVELTNLTLQGGLNISTFGGGLRVQAGSVTTKDVTIRNNQSIYGAGAIVYGGGSLSMTDGAVSNNTATALGANQGWGGGVLVLANGTLNLKGTTVSGNHAAGANFIFAGLGGGVFSSGTATINDATFSGNRASGNAASVAGYGGSIYHGGGAANHKMTVTNTDVKGGALASNAAVGGGLVIASDFEATDLTVSGNVAERAGGIFANGKASLKGSAVSGNKATSTTVGYGGGLEADQPNASSTIALTLDDTRVENNQAGLAGGGAALGFGVDAELKNGSKVTGNTAAAGGGVYNSGSLTARDSSIDDNNASFQGGGVYNGSSTASDTPRLTLVDSTVDDNDAPSGGGGITTIVKAKVTATGGHINGNSAIGGGGLLVGDGGETTFDGTDFVGNTASNLGGGAVLNAGATTITDATLRDNTAVHTTGSTGAGGAIYSGSNTANAATTLTVRRSAIVGNEAYAAAAILTASQGSGATNKASVDNSTIAANTNEAAFGAIEQFHPMTITNSTITGNTAGGNASGAFALLAPNQLGLAGSIVSGNSGPECNAAVNNGGRNLSDPGDSSCGFSAAKNDVAAPALLGPLGDHGGPTETLIPGPASKALDHIAAGASTGLNDAVTGNAVTLCGSGAKDQRGVARPQGAKCDIGAAEVVQVAPTVDGPNSVEYSIDNAGAPVTFTSTGTPQATLSVEGDLPAGVTFEDNGDGTGTLSGTPTAGPGGVKNLVIKATNEAGTGTKDFELRLLEAPDLSGPAAATYTVGEAGGPDVFEQIKGFPVATLSLMGTLPGGVSFTPQDGGKGTVSGTPAAGSGGEYDVTVKADNGTPPPATRPFALTVREAPSIDGPASSTFTVGTAGSSASFTTGGFPKPELSAVGLPDGLTLSGTGTGQITGTPADGTGGEHDITVRATNGVGDDATRDSQVVVREAPELVGPSTARLVAGVQGEVVYSADGYPEADLSVSGTLPAGVTFVDHGNGSASLKGTPPTSAVGSYDLTIKASNGVDPVSTIHLTLDVVPELAITTTTLADAPHKSAYVATVAATGGQPPYDFELVSGSLPAGLTLNSDGTITGSPTAAAGVKSFTVKVTDAANPRQSDTQQLSIRVVRGPTELRVDPVLIQTKASTGMFNLGLKVGVVSATLKGGAPAEPIANALVVFKVNKFTVCTGRTNSAGKVTCKMSAIGTAQAILRGKVTGTYAGNGNWLPSSGDALLAGKDE